MDPQGERRRNPDVPKPHGQRWTDRMMTRGADRTREEELWLWAAKLWAAAAIIGAAYGAARLDLM
jgi:hypothetical protein